MKFWIAYKTSDNASIFEDESSLISYVAKERIKGNSDIKIRIIEANIIDETTVGDLFNSIEKSNDLDYRIKASLSEYDFFNKIEKFRSLYDRYTDGSNIRFLTHLSLTINDKEKTLKFIKGNKEYLLCDVSDDVEWFECLISLGINEMVDGSYKKINGWNTKVMVSKKRKDNFLKAKNNLSTRSGE